MQRQHQQNQNMVVRDRMAQGQRKESEPVHSYLTAPQLSPGHSLDHPSTFRNARIMFHSNLAREHVHPTGGHGPYNSSSLSSDLASMQLIEQSEYQPLTDSDGSSSSPFQLEHYHYQPYAPSEHNPPPTIEQMPSSTPQQHLSFHVASSPIEGDSSCSTWSALRTTSQQGQPAHGQPSIQEHQSHDYSKQREETCSSASYFNPLAPISYAPEAAHDAYLPLYQIPQQRRGAVDGSRSVWQRTPPNQYTFPQDHLPTGSVIQEHHGYHRRSHSSTPYQRNPSSPGLVRHNGDDYHNGEHLPTGSRMSHTLSASSSRPQDVEQWASSMPNQSARTLSPSISEAPLVSNTTVYMPPSMSNRVPRSLELIYTSPYQPPLTPKRHSPGADTTYGSTESRSPPSPFGHILLPNGASCASTPPSINAAPQTLPSPCHTHRVRGTRASKGAQVAACENAHSETRPFVCKGDCGRGSNCNLAYVSKSSLKRHLLPKGKREVQCERCGHEITRQNIARHKGTCTTPTL